MADKNKFFRSLLATGFLFFLTGIILMLILPAKRVDSFSSFFFLFLIIVSTFVIYMSIICNNYLFLYLGLNLFVYSIGATIIKINFLESELKRLWPIMLISFGITLIPAGYIKMKKFKTVYIVPATFLSILGIVFMLFSFKIIKVSFGTFFKYAWPVLLILAGLFLIIYYFYSQTSTKTLLDDDLELEKDEN
jgi:hypothetical protein